MSVEPGRITLLKYSRNIFADGGRRENFHLEGNLSDEVVKSYILEFKSIINQQPQQPIEQPEYKGEVMDLDDPVIGWIRYAMNNFDIINIQGESDQYRISFHRGELNWLADELPLILEDHGYPRCTCPSYEYGSYHPRGGCKHIHKLFEIMHLDFHKVDWPNRD
jgi:hypothetical protein